jgi:hypothetical protein
MSMDVQTKILENGDLELKMIFKSNIDKANFKADFNNAEYDNLKTTVIDIIETDEKNEDLRLVFKIENEDPISTVDNDPDKFTDLNSSHEYIESKMGWFHDLGKLGKTILKRVRS